MIHTNDREKIGEIISVSTGEVINSLYSGDKIITSNQNEYAKEHFINFKKGDSFVKVFINPIIELFKELSTKEYAVAMALMPFISYKDGILRYNNKIVDGKEICDILGESYDTFKKVIPSLIKHEVLARIERESDTYLGRIKKCLVVNPYIFLRGQDIEKDIVDLFRNSKWATLV